MLYTAIRPWYNALRVTQVCSNVLAGSRPHPRPAFRVRLLTRARVPWRLGGFVRRRYGWRQTRGPYITLRSLDFLVATMEWTLSYN